MFCVVFNCISYIVPAWSKLHVFLSVFALFHWSFWVFPRNRLAVQSLPPGGTSEMITILVLAWTAWRRDTVRVFFLCFDAIRTSVHVVSVINVSGFYWILCWTEIDYQFGVWQGLRVDSVWIDLGYTWGWI